MTSKRQNWQPYFAETVSQLLAKHTFGGGVSQEFFAAKTVEGVTGVNVLTVLGRTCGRQDTRSVADRIARTVGMKRLDHGSQVRRGDLIVFPHGDRDLLGVCLGIKGVAVVEGDIVYTHMPEVETAYTYA